MNQQHLIDNAIFDTAFAADAVPFERRTEIEAFVKKDLMNVVDEVFNQLDALSGADEQVLRIGDLDIDLGEISFAEYRQQMPKKLREQLLLALGDLQLPPSAGARAKPERIDRNSAEQAQLFYFLRFGYLPWYSRLEGGDALETLLREAIDSTPAALLDFMRENASRAAVMTRLQQQFSAPVVERVRRLLSPAKAGSAAQAEHIHDLHAQLVAALRSGDVALIPDAMWGLHDSHPELLRTTLQFYGQQLIVRQRIVTALSPRRFVTLLRLLEPVAWERITSMLEQLAGIEEILGGTGQSQFDSQKPEDSARSGQLESTADGNDSNDLAKGSADRSRMQSALRESVLAYLLVERDARFDDQHFIDSLLRQLASSSFPGKQSESVAGVTQRLSELADDARAPASAHAQSADAQAVSGVEAYRQYQRLKLALTTPRADRRVDEPGLGLLADLRARRQDSPWLLMRLYRESQTSNAISAWAIESLDVRFLLELTDLFVIFASQTGATRTGALISGPGETELPVALSELARAIRSHAEKSNNRQRYYAHIIRCLVRDELIDFDAIPAVEQQTAAATSETINESVAGPVPAAARRDESIASDATELERGVAATIETAPARLLQCAELLTTACYATTIALSVQELDQLKWRFIEAYLIDTGNLFNEKYFTLQYVASLLRQAKVKDTRRFREALSQSLQQNSLPSTAAMVRRLTQWLADESEVIAGIVVDTARAADEPADEVKPLEDIHIANAGVVLFAPYLPRLFERLGLTADGQFKSRDATERGVHCLQFLVNASSSSPEYQLVLNKLLCGVRPGRPIRRGIELSGDDVEQLEGLLQAVIEHWKALGNTSIAGLRESFLQRSGRLQRDNDAWRLAVESRPFDMLLDQLPWSFATIKFPWMERVIYVEWR